MYYIVCGGTIVDSSTRCPTEEELQQWADECGECYVIRGEHTGMTAEAIPRKKYTTGDKIIVLQDIPGIIVGEDEYGRLTRGECGTVHCITDDGRVAVDFGGEIHVFAPDTRLIERR